MRRITLIGTTHREAGKCNDEELEKILLAIEPEVIFEELRPADFQSFYSDISKHTVEIRAIKRYLQFRKAHQEPVDSYEMPESFGLRLHTLDEFVKSRSPEYLTLVDQMYENKFQLGYSYLNSQDFIFQIRKSEQLYSDVIHAFGNNLAISTLSERNIQLRRRDGSMLENIRNFCHKTTFREAVFLVGAGHLSSLMEDIESRWKDISTSVSWKFWGKL